MNALLEAHSDYRLVERAIALIAERAEDRPALGSLAMSLGVSEGKLQRTFSAWAGISPKRFLALLTREHARRVLARAEDVLGATLDAGLSSPGRLHDLLVTIEAVTPGDVRLRGEGLTIRWGVGPTPFGPAFVAATARGVHRLEFLEESAGAVLRALATEWPRAELREDRRGTADLLGRIFAPRGRPLPLHLWVRGTNFQVQVWQALLRVPAGRLVSYGDLARFVEAPRAVRAVGSALAANPVAYAIPCHRVLRREGALGGYRWSEPRKLALIGWEAARHAP